MIGPINALGAAAAALMFTDFGIADDLATARYRRSYREPPKEPITMAERNRILNARAAKAKKRAKRKAASKARRNA